MHGYLPIPLPLVIKYISSVTVRDITEHKLAEEALRESEKRFRELSDLLPLIVYEVDTDGNLTYTNHIAFEYFGYTDDDFKQGLNVMQMLAPVDLERAAAAFRAIVEGKGTVVRPADEYMALRKDGSTFPISIYSSPIVVNGRITGFRGIIVDITERKQAEVALRENKERYRDLIETTSDWIWEVDKAGKYTYVSPKIRDILGYEPDEVIGKTPFDLMPPGESEKIAGIFISYVIAQKPFTGLENINLHKDGRHVVLETSGVPFFDDGHALLGYRGIDRDITDRKRAEEAFRQSNKKLNLLSSITRHDINNQLTVILGYLSMLKSKLHDSAFDEHLQTIATSAKQISATIQFAKEYEAIGANPPVWQDCHTLVEAAAKQVPLGKVMVKNEIPSGAEVFADPLIVKVFYNLIDNAVRHGGKITTIQFSMQKVGDDRVIRCEDDGDGIARVEKERIFERGFGKNTGLGLFLAREILEITRITIRETGEPGKGARFEITVPKGAYRI